MKCAFRICFSTLALLLTTTFVFADDAKKETKPAADAKKPSEAATKEQRKPAEAAARGERKAEEAKPGAERKPREGGGPRSDFPAEIKLTEDQQKKLTDLRTEFGGKFGESNQQREALLTDEQKSARVDVEKKLRDGGLNRQEYADALAAALKLTAEQKTKLEAHDVEAGKLRREYEVRRLAVLTDEQKQSLLKIQAAQNVERMFQFPGDITLTEEQKKGLKALHDELGPEFVTLSGKRDVIMTEERRTALQAAMKEARESNKDRQALSDAVDAALKLSDAEKTELRETEGKLYELRAKIQERKLAVLTPEQKQEFEKKNGSRR